MVLAVLHRHLRWPYAALPERFEPFYDFFCAPNPSPFFFYLLLLQKR